MVRADASLEAVHCCFWCFGLRAGRDSRVQAEHIQRFRRKFVGERADRIQRGQVADHGHAAAGLLRRLGGPGGVAVQVIHIVPRRHEALGRVEPYPLGGAGDRDVEGIGAKKDGGEQGGHSG